MKLGSAVLIGGLASLMLPAVQAAPQNLLWQSDLAIRSLTVSEAKGSLTARIVIGIESGEALATRVDVLLPVGVGIVTMASGCVPGPNRTGIRELRARVVCDLGNLSAHTARELYVVTTNPPRGVARGFAIIVMSDTPDPKPSNNFAQRMIPSEDQIKWPW